MNYTYETLVAYLRKCGVTYLAPSDAVATKVIELGEELILGLLESSEPRLQMALVPLFIFTICASGLTKNELSNVQGFMR